MKAKYKIRGELIEDVQWGRTIPGPHGSEVSVCPWCEALKVINRHKAYCQAAKEMGWPQETLELQSVECYQCGNTVGEDGLCLTCGSGKHRISTKNT